MSQTGNISPAIIESLYAEAFKLAEEARAAFDPVPINPPEDDCAEDDRMRAALSREALRSTTRIMHSMTWLLNRKAYFDGNMSEFQVRHHGRLPPAPQPGDADELAVFEPELRDLVARICAHHDRIRRLDRGWHDSYALPPGAVQRLRGRLGQTYAIC